MWLSGIRLLFYTQIWGIVLICFSCANNTEVIANSLSTTLYPGSNSVSTDQPPSQTLSSNAELKTVTSKACSGNSANNRTAWCEYDIGTDYYSVVPDTGVTREYWLNVEDVTIAPDGYPRKAMAVNGTIPGPTIYADWGDQVVVHVTNNLVASKNGSSIHWHGVRQNYTNQNDGVVSITQCPIAPGSSMTYRWRAVQYGSSWYHSHIGLQAWEGVFGGIVINGPATANYEEDRGILFLNDWSHQTADELYLAAQLIGPPTLDNGLINGTNVYGAGNDTIGSRYTMKVNKGGSYRLRLVNAAIDTHWKFMVDNHTLTVIAMDFVPIVPYSTKVLDIAIAQRYDVILTADQAAVASSFWIRAIPQEQCSENASPNNIKGILHYGNDTQVPRTTAYKFEDSCDDEDPSKLVPYVAKTVASADWRFLTDVSVHRNSQNLFRWYLNSTTMEVLWDNPTLKQIHNNSTKFPTSSGVIELPRANEWVYLMINNTVAVDHPIHLHGHDFYVLAQGTNPWDGSVNTENPPRRDTAMLPGNGYLFIAFETNNPGAWLMHCHIGWHTSQGFALQFVERYNETRGLIDYSSLNQTCDSWSSYYTANNVQQDDSGV